MTTEEAVIVARIMIAERGVQRSPSRQVADLLNAFATVDMADFFNALDDYLDPVTHDEVFGILERRREGRE